MSVVEEAQKWIGKVQYVFGAENVEGGEADCSSFVQYVFKKNGIDLPRVADDQARSGTEISKDNLQSGDLVFFQNTYQTDGASHVGIYIGNDQFIDCGSTGVRVSNLNSNYWKEHWYKAVRVNGSASKNGTVSSGNNGSLSSISGNTISGIATFFIVLLIVVLGMFFLSQAFDIPLNPLK